VPDDAFETYLEGNIPGAYNGSYNDNYISSTINTFLPYAIVLNGATNPITDLTGVEFLSNCRLLHLTNIAIPNLDLTGLLAPNIEIHASPLILSITLPEIIIGSLDIDGNSQLNNIVFQNNTKFSPLPNSSLPGMLNVYIQNNPSLTECDMSTTEILGGSSVLWIINNSNLNCLNIANGDCFMWLQVIISNNPVLSCVTVDNPNYSITNGNWIWVYLGNNLTNYSTSCIGCVAGIDEEIIDEISISPNPTTSKISVKSNAEFIGKEFIIYDQLGKAIKSGIISSEDTEIDLSNLTEGIYIFKVGSDMQESFKIIKQ
jgi:hypothetical protein